MKNSKVVYSKSKERERDREREEDSQLPDKESSQIEYLKTKNKMLSQTVKSSTHPLLSTRSRERT